MKPTLPILFLLMVTSCTGVEKYVAASYPNGKPEVVIFMEGKGPDAEKVMEKVYYPNGQLDYVGRYQNGVEHGEWTYYYEDGTIKFKEQWVNGLEEGVHLDYAPDGQVHRELHYKQGKLVKEVNHSNNY